MNDNRISRNARILRHTGALALGAALAACSASNDGPRAAASDTSPTAHAASAGGVTDPLTETWRQAMSKTAPPHDGCFHAEYPSSTWVEAPCAPAPARHIPTQGPLRPNAANAASGKRATATSEGKVSPEVVGHGTDWFAKSSGTITQATGSFPQVTGATSPNAYSLQLNTNAFPLPSTSPLCGGSTTCSAAQQAVYSSSVNQTGAWFEYVVLGAKGCPSGFSLDAGNCYKPSASIPNVPLVGLADLSTMHIELQSNASSDIFTMTIEGKAYAESFPSVLGLGDGGWNSAEFGLYGDLGGSQASVSPGATLVTQLVTAPASNTVSCSSGQNVDTAESNTLDLVSGCCLGVDQGSTPGIQFEQSNVSGESCSLCGAAGQACCGGSTACFSASDVCQQGVCGLPNTLVASPSALSVQDGDGTSGLNRASTNLVASGYWAGNDVNAPTLTVGSLPSGVSWTITNDINPPTVQFTANDSAPAGTYTIPITGTIGSYHVTTDVTLTIGACQPISCSAAGWVCGSFDNGCGGTSSCGSCPSGESCTGGGCYKCAERTCPSPEFFNLETCECQKCACGTLQVDGHILCAVCKPEVP
jgi:hypothetical protein